MFLAPWSRSHLKKNTGAGAGAAPKKTGAGAAKNMRLLYRFLEEENIIRKLFIR